MYIEKSVEEFPLLGQYKGLLDGHNGFIVGGFFRSFFMGEEPRDVDIFFASEEDFESAALFFQGEAELTKHKNNFHFLDKKTGFTIDLIGFRQGSIPDTLDGFDFTVTKFALYKKTAGGIEEYKCLYHPFFFEHLALRLLVLDGWQGGAPRSVYSRMIRYQKHGFTPTRETKRRIHEAVQAAPPEENAGTPEGPANTDTE